MNKLSFKGIALAMLLVLALDAIAGIAMTAFMGSNAFSEEMTEQQMNDAIAAMTLSTNFLLGSIILGTLSTMVGGYLAARIAKKEPYWNAGAIGVLGIVLGLLLAKDYPLWFNVVGFLLALPAALLGGHLARSRINKYA